MDIYFFKTVPEGRLKIGWHFSAGPMTGTGLPQKMSTAGTTENHPVVLCQVDLDFQPSQRYFFPFIDVLLFALTGTKVPAYYQMSLRDMSSPMILPTNPVEEADL